LEDSHDEEDEAEAEEKLGKPSKGAGASATSSSGDKRKRDSTNQGVAAVKKLKSIMNWSNSELVYGLHGAPKCNVSGRRPWLQGRLAKALRR